MIKIKVHREKKSIYIDFLSEEFPKLALENI